MYITVYRAERYYWYYREYAIFWNNIIQVFLLATALSGVAGLWIWSKIPAIWAVVAGASQVLGAAAYLLPQSDQIRALNYLLPELQELLNQIDHDWNLIDLPDPPSDAELNDRILTYNNKYAELENKYTNGTPFPRKKWVEQTAEKDRNNYLLSHFGVSVEEETKNAKE